jgi:hypothetical protein
MAMSTVNFRMQSNIGTAWEQVPFSGNGIKLIDLKKVILDKNKKFTSLDFDLKTPRRTAEAYWTK